MAPPWSVWAPRFSVPGIIPLDCRGFWLMGILDELKKLTHPYDDEDEEYEDFEEPRERSFDDHRNKAEDRRNKVVNIHATTQLKVVLVKPEPLTSFASLMIKKAWGSISMTI